jgi:hypothetical protein
MENKLHKATENLLQPFYNGTSTHEYERYGTRTFMYSQTFLTYVMRESMRNLNKFNIKQQHK